MLGFRLGRRQRRLGARLHRPGSLGELCLGDRRIALVGEAAGFISPSSAEGISYAFRSARALARSLLAGFPCFLGRYRIGTLELAINLIFKNLKAPFLYTPALRGLVMRSGVTSMKVDPEP